ncbi:MAG: LegC family aminotransferase [Vulcanimicrobiaceae bacterium]
MGTPISYEPGARVDGTIPLCVPEIRGNEWRYVKECLDSGWVSSVGSYVTAFEDVVARAAGKKYGVATVNGTAALHIALLIAGVVRDDAVLVSTMTFIAPANAIRYVGAHPIFIDAEARYWQMDADATMRFCQERCTFELGVLRETATGRRVRALLPVSVLGHPVALADFRAIADRFGLALIEDTTESLGTRYRGRPAGAGADISCFSFNGNKLVTTGGGGMLCTDDESVAKRARYLTTQAKDDPIEYVHGTVGYNYRLTNVQAAMGVAQFELLDEFIAAKRDHAARYTEAFAAIPGISPPPEASDAFCTYWLYTILIDEAAYGRTSRSLLKVLGEAGIQARPLWQPMHLSPAHVGGTASGGDVAARLCRDALSLPSSVGLTPQQLDSVVRVVNDARGVR